MSSIVPHQPPLFPDPERKRCARCGIEKALDDFPVQTSRQSGRHSYCKLCWVQYQRERRPEPPRSYVAPGPVGLGVKQCPRCGVVKSLTAFGADNARQNGRFPYCKECRQKDPAVRREHVAQRKRGLYRCGTCQRWLPRAGFGANAYHKDGRNKQCKECNVVTRHLRRARQSAAGGSHTSLEWARLKKAFTYHCLMCGAQEPAITLTEDHIVPISLGGSNFIDNIQPLCCRCNERKATKVLDLRRDSPWRDPAVALPTCLVIVTDPRIVRQCSHRKRRLLRRRRVHE